jgi:hypothetical protein
MQVYQGTKKVVGFLMTRGEYNTYRGWIIPADENPDDTGYLVEYTDGDKPNDDRHKGYISWSPSDVFENSYKPCGTHVQRVQIEYDELMEKRLLLRKFMETEIFFDLPAKQRRLLEQQREAMELYSIILAERISTVE